MLSITGMTLEQFANLMEGLGYRAERGEREKPLPVDKVIPGDGGAADDTGPAMDADAPPGAVTDAPAPETVADKVEQINDEGVAPVAETAQSADTAEQAAVDGEPARETFGEETPTGEAADAAVDEDRIEVFYTFTWGGNRGGNQQQRRGKPRGKREGKPKGKGKPRRDGGGGKPRSFESRPQKKDRIDPDNPFAQALMGLKTKDD
jgi:ATP-dependent RNA helicase SUPV3L1/SUV3